MKVIKFKNTVHLKLDDLNESIYEPYGDELFWNDLNIESSDGWSYLHDSNRNQVCFLDGYGFNIVDELKTGKTVVLYYRENDPEYESTSLNLSLT